MPPGVGYPQWESFYNSNPDMAWMRDAGLDARRAAEFHARKGTAIAPQAQRYLSSLNNPNAADTPPPTPSPLNHPVPNSLALPPQGITGPGVPGYGGQTPQPAIPNQVPQPPPGMQSAPQPATQNFNPSPPQSIQNILGVLNNYRNMRPMISSGVRNSGVGGGPNPQSIIPQDPQFGGQPPNPNTIPPFQAAIPPGLTSAPPQMNFEQLAPILLMLRQFGMRGPFSGGQ